MSERISIDEAINKLRMGGVVALPTETVYGLGAVATLAQAVARIFAIKHRPADNPLICHFNSVEMIERYTEPLPAYVLYLIQQLTPGPVSFLLNLNAGDGQLLKAATCGRNTVVCRIPEHWLTLSVIKQLNVPIAAPSANTSGQVSATTGQMVLDDIGDKIDGVVDGGACLIGLESTILDCRKDNEIAILRPGAVGYDMLHELLADKFSGIHIITPTILTETIPGAMYKHYAPLTPVQTITYQQAQTMSFNQDDIVIACEENLRNISVVRHINLGSTTDIEYIAQHLYQNIHRIDSMHSTQAYYIQHAWGTTALETAIANRLEKAFAAH